MLSTKNFLTLSKNTGTAEGKQDDHSVGSCQATLGDGALSWSATWPDIFEIWGCAWSVNSIYSSISSSPSCGITEPWFTRESLSEAKGCDVPGWSTRFKHNRDFSNIIRNIPCWRLKS